MRIASLLFLLFVSPEVIIYAKKNAPVRSLCDDPYVTAADRLPNDTIRVYRDDYYWELPGVGDRKVKPMGPYPVWFKYMAPVSKTSSVMTVVSGPMEGTVWKFERSRYWQWQANGRQVIGTKGGAEWSEMPAGGFDCVLNDGDLDGKGFPLMIGFRGVRVYYWKTYQSSFEKVGDIYNGYKNGQYGEDFPSDLTACTAVRLSKKGSGGYYVLLFRKKQYCLRPIKGEKGCKEWGDNRELFGCPAGGSSSSGSDQPSSGNNKPAPEPGPNGGAPEPEPGVDVDNDMSGSDNGSDRSGAQNLLLLLLSLVIASHLMNRF